MERCKPEGNGRREGHRVPLQLGLIHSITLRELNSFNQYYNSISRQSGIVHKDKAMRQLETG